MSASVAERELAVDRESLVVGKMGEVIFALQTSIASVRALRTSGRYALAIPLASLVDAKDEVDSISTGSDSLIEDSFVVSLRRPQSTLEREVEVLFRMTLLLISDLVSSCSH
jgi:hypothetical protein